MTTHDDWSLSAAEVGLKIAEQWRESEEPERGALIELAKSLGVYGIVSRILSGATRKESAL